MKTIMSLNYLFKNVLIILSVIVLLPDTIFACSTFALIKGKEILVGNNDDESWPGPCRYPAPDDRPAIDEIQWLQYQFDNCATVDEVIQNDSKIRIVKFFGRSH